MNCSAKMFLATLCGLVLLSVGTPAGYTNQGDKAMATHLDNFEKEDRLYNVVKIRGAKGNGYGLIIARNFDSLLVATARHILHDDFVNNIPGPNTTLRVRLYGIERYWQGIPGRTYEPPAINGVPDLAVIEVSVPREPGVAGRPFLKSEFWREKIIVTDPCPGTPVELAATVNDIGYAGGSGQIARVEKGRAVRFDHLEGEPGQSGAPVATDRGFIGLYLGSGTQQVIPLPDIRDAIVKEYGAPFWGLFAVDPRSTAAQLCVRVRGARIDEVAISGPYGLVKFDEYGCAGSTTGNHFVVGNRIGLMCAPSSFSFIADTSEPYAITCTIDPSGIWSTLGQGYLYLKLLRDNVWDLTLDLPRNRGQIRGKVMGSPPDLYLDGGVLAGGMSVSGSIRVNGDKLSIDLTTGTDFFEGIYTR